MQNGKPITVKKVLVFRNVMWWGSSGQSQLSEAYTPTSNTSALSESLSSLKSDVELINELLGITKDDNSGESSESPTSTTLNGLSSLTSEMLTISNEFKGFVEALGIGRNEETNTMTINANLLATGDATFSNATLSGELNVGLLEIGAQPNTINVLGASCLSDASELNEGLCENQALYLQKNLSGNVNVFSGKIVLEPNGTINLSKLVLVVDDPTSASAGVVIIPAGQLFVVIETKALTPNSLILATPKAPVAVGTEVVELNKFTINLAEAKPEDVKIDWLIVDAKTQGESNNP